MESIRDGPLVGESGETEASGADELPEKMVIICPTQIGAGPDIFGGLSCLMVYSGLAPLLSTELQLSVWAAYLQRVLGFDQYIWGG